MIEGQSELSAGLHETEHGVPRRTSVMAHCTTGNLALDDKGSQIVLGRIGVKRDRWMLKYLEQIMPAPVQACQDPVKILISRMDGEDAVKAMPERFDLTGRGLLLEGFECLVETPHEIANGIDLPGLARCGWHQLVQETLGVNPAQRMVGYPELPGIIGDNNGAAQKSVVTDAATDAGFAGNADQPGVEDINAALRQMLQE